MLPPEAENTEGRLRGGRAAFKVESPGEGSDMSRVEDAAYARISPKQAALPGLVFASVLAPSPGRKKAVLIVEKCPQCDGAHVHRGDWPLPKMLSRRGGCGTRYLLYPAKRRMRRAA